MSRAMQPLHAYEKPWGASSISSTLPNLRAGINLVYEALYGSSLRSCPVLKHLRLLRPGAGISLRSASFNPHLEQEKTKPCIPKDSELTTKVFPSEAVFISLLMLFYFVATD